ncbi:hypothetical protein [Brevibacillus sp. AY1]|uniref:hypothetical protein n=1 Tax=Brevibacillus sp. AY1 TaxID=2807621 RepID=UPI0024564DBC|nr:hypothetical protein [Brevibacillus sp. AY1]MDH4617851.1 hypothetical protein [Brevibacillus sp. AY1]
MNRNEIREDQISLRSPTEADGAQVELMKRSGRIASDQSQLMVKKEVMHESCYRGTEPITGVCANGVGG